MKTLIYSVFLLVLLVACNKPTKEMTHEVPQGDKIPTKNESSVFVGEHQAKVMILGVFHLHNPGLDTYKQKFSFDILKEKRQKELTVLLQKVAAFKPTKILLEVNRIKKDSILNVRYQNYLANRYDITKKRNEIYQIGFKLAKKLNHTRVYASDASAKWFGVKVDWDNYDNVAYLKSKGQYKKSKRYDYDSFYRQQDSLKTIQSLIEHLFMLNQPKNTLKDHQAYLTENILEGAGDNYLGADAVAVWYRRNLRIFSNAYDLTNFDKEERLLLIYGAGHVRQLRQLFKDSPDYEYIEVNDYLSK